MRSSSVQHRSIWIIPVLCMTFSAAHAQFEPVEIFGIVTDQDTKAIIHQGIVIATDRHEASHTITVELDSTGSYSLELPYDHSIRIEFTSPDYVPRHVLVDLNNVPIASRRAGFGMEIDAVLFKELPGIDYSIFEEEPTAICLYDKELKTLVWDMSYIVSTKKLVQGTLEEHRAISGSGK